MAQVRLRFAPSPTGYLHIGGLRTALFNDLYARHEGGAFILRIEDTDRTRFVEGALENLIRILDWAGLHYDEGPKLVDGRLVEVGDKGPYIQSDRVKQGIYRRYADQLIAEGKAYYCFCTKERLDAVRDAQKANGETPRYDGYCREHSREEAQARIDAGEPYVIRMKLPPHTDIHFKDLIKGDITINTDEMDDQVLIKSDGFPTYHFAVVVDDHLMGITHVVRGEEWLTSTPKHCFLYDCFGWEKPEYVHLPTVLGQDHKKLSKRNGDVSVELFVRKGYLKDALINYIALLGWSPNSNEEILSMEALIEQFDFTRVSNTGGIFDVDKLNWVNQQYIKALSAEACAAQMKPYLIEAGLIDEAFDDAALRLVAETYQSRIEYFAQVPEMTKHLFVPADQLHYSDEAIETISTPPARELLMAFKAKLDEHGAMDRDFAANVVKSIQAETGVKGKALWFPIRAAIVGETSGPDFTNTLLVLGYDEVQARIDHVLKNFGA